MRCFKCGKTEKRGASFDNSKSKPSPSSICVDCFKGIKLTGSKLLHEQAKIKEDDPNFDLLRDESYMKEWNRTHPV